MNTRRAIFITSSLFAGLVFTGCSSSVSRSSDASDSAATTDTVATEDATSTSVAGGETGTGSGNGGGTVTSAGAPTTTFPKITPVTKAAPPATTTTDPNTGVLVTISVQGLLPDVLTLTGKTLFLCGEIPLSGKTPVSWTTSKASSVRLTIDSARATSGLPAIGSYAVPLTCGDTQKVTVTAIGSNGTVGRSKTISITVMP